MVSGIRDKNNTVQRKKKRNYSVPSLVTCKNPFQISFADGIFAFQPMFSYGQRSKCADLLNSYEKTKTKTFEEEKRIMKTRKVMALAGAGVLAVSMMTGCGSSSSTASTTAAATTTAAAAETAKEAATTAAEKKADLTGSITAAGSSALKPLVDDAADMFIEKYPDVSITIDAGGSGEGLKQVSEGTVNIGNSDVEASAKLDETQAKELVDHQVCVVTMAPIVNNDVKEGGVENLTKQQLIDIFTGKTTNWKEVGGPDESIVLVTRPTSSGTRATFQKYALDGNEEASNTSMETDDSGVLLQNVKDTKGAIGYVALSYLTGDAGVATVAIDGAEPTLENTYAGKYPVWTFEHMYTKGEPDEVVSAFLDYIMSDEYGAKMES